MSTPLRQRARARIVNAVRHRLNPARTPAKQTRSPRFAAQFKKVGRILLGPDALPEQPADLRWDEAVIYAAARSNALATFARMISRGAALEDAQVATTRALLSVSQEHYRQRYTARGLAEGMASARARHLGHGLVLHEKSHLALAWARLSQVDEDTLTRLVPLEAVDGALAVGTPEAVSAAVSIAERASELGTRDVIALSGRFLVTGHQELARMLVEEADRRHEDDLEIVARRNDYSARDELENVRRWTHPTPSDQRASALDGVVNVAVIDYYQPDLKRTSRNVGDYVQTLAMLSNLACFQQARFTGGNGLGELVTSLQGRVRPELRIDDGDADVYLMPVSRDFSEGEDVPEKTWMVAFGWHMHSLFQLRFGLPYHPNLNPVFVSFHLNTIKALTPETIAYLKAHGPIGCRDWTTVDLLLSAGVDAFFTGCLSTTVNAIFPKIDDVEREQPGAVAVIDAPVAPVKANRPIEALTHRDPRYREADLAEGTRLAIELLETYQRRYHRIVTSRLHSYLPAISLGVPVKFKPRRIGDVRFDGLLGMTPDAPELTAMRDGIRRLLAATFEKIFAGASRDEVYAQWREITASQVAEARKRQEAPLQPDESVRAIDIPALVKTVREGARTFGPHDAVDPATVSDLALAVDHNLRQHLPTTLESLIGNASSPLRLWVLSRGLDEGYQQWISDAWPDVPITFLNLDGIKYGDIGRMNPAITVSTMDRLVLSELLSDLDRITYVDVDTVTEGDVCELAATDLGGYPLAARTAVYSAAEQWRAAGNLLSAEKASELRRMMSARHAFDYKGFNAGVLVLDLARMRADDFAATHLPLVARFGLHDQDVLVAYVGPNRAELDEKWNALPIREEITATGIIHFVGPLKPWNEELTPYGEHWKLYAERVRARVGEPPASPDGVEERLVPTTTALSRPVEVVLHVGMGKTGTSSIQFFLRDNRERLAGLGVLFPTSPGRARHARLSLFSKTEEELVRLPEWARQKDSDPAQFRSDFRRQLFAEIEDSGLARVLFSDEVIFGSPNPVLRRLHGLLDQFAKRLRLVAYLRRQDEHMVSRYQQGVKIGWVMRLREWAAEDMTELYDYHARLQRLEQLLAPSELVVRRFEQDAFADGSLFQDFLDAAGIDARAGEMEPVASRNKSLDAESVEFLRLLNVHRVVSDGATPGLIDNRQLVARLAEVSSGPKLTMPAPFLDEFMAQWEESNSAVAREFLGDESGQLFRSRREARNTTTKQHFDPARLDHFVTLLELPEEIHAPLRRLAEREATVR